MITLSASISIVTVVLNDQEGIKATWRSLQNLDLSQIEWVVIDGYSTDGTYEFLMNLTENSRIKLFRQKPEGIYHAMNLAISHCSGSWLWFLNAGDLNLSKSLLQELRAAIRNNPSINMYVSSVIFLSTTGYIYDAIRPNVVNLNGQPVLNANHQGILFEAGTIKKAKGYDVTFSYSADGDLISRIFSVNQIYFSNSIIASFRLGGRSLQNFPQTQREIKRYRPESDNFFKDKLFLFRSFLRLLLLRFENFPATAVPISIYLRMREKYILSHISNSWEIDFDYFLQLRNIIGLSTGSARCHKDT